MEWRLDWPPFFGFRVVFVESLLPLLSYAFVSSITPGPNNLMLSASGVAFGWKRTLPHMFGVPTGFTLLLLVCGYGVGALIERSPIAAMALQVGGTVYLLYLTWAMRNAFGPDAAKSRPRPFAFIEAVFFQFANPKAWVMALTTVSVFLPAFGGNWLGLAIVCAAFVIVNIPCIMTWVLVGVSARRYLASGRRRTAFSTAIVVMMLYTVVAIWI
jgi:threonine/homoserine/homoserine lactone efflux protein